MPRPKRTAPKAEGIKGTELVKAEPEVKKAKKVKEDAAPPAPAFQSYESRIAIIEAWQYQAKSLHDAPDFIDRRWIGFDGGPILRVRLHGDEAEPTICYEGDYIVRQMFTITPEVEAEERLEVWKRHEFERLFIPRAKNAPQPDKDKLLTAPIGSVMKVIPGGFPIAAEPYDPATAAQLAPEPDEPAET